MTLANSSVEDAAWLTIWAGGTSDPVTQTPKSFGSISVPFKEHYTIQCNGEQATSSSPSILAIYDGKKVEVLSAIASKAEE